MGQNCSTLEGATAAERKIRTDSGETAQGHTNTTWRNSASAVMTSVPPVSGDAATGDQPSVRQKMEVEASRMSIRAVIDTFIENCLTTSSDEKVTEKSAISSIGSTNKSSYDSSGSINSGSSTRDGDGSEDISSENDSKNQGKSNTNDAENKDVITCSDAKSLVENTGNGITDVVIGSFSDNQKDEMHECRSGSTDLIKESVKDNSVSELTDKTSIKQTKIPVNSEKLSFSAYLQDQLQRIDHDKREELAQLALTNDLQCQGQMIMWELAKKPDALPNLAGAPSEPAGSHIPLAPVRLQTLIDKVLDSSLNSQTSLPAASCSPMLQDSSIIKQNATVDIAQVKFPQTVKEQQGSHSLSAKNTSPQKEKRLCFKDHIEKVLLESFLSYEEEERKEALKNEGVSNGTSAQMDPLKQSNKKENIVSVQDIVDQVISQTEVISKLLTPSGMDTGKFTPSSSRSEEITASSSSSTQLNPAPKYSISPQSRALIEAQRHTVQKEHQSSTNMGRKRGRPQLNSIRNSVASIPEPGKDLKSFHYNDRTFDKGEQAQSSFNTHHYVGPPSVTNYCAPATHPYRAPGSITFLMSSDIATTSSTNNLQNRHYMPQKSAESSSAGRTTMSLSTSSGYHQKPQHSFVHQQGIQPLSSQVRHHQHHSLPHQHQPNAKAPPPLILADHLKDSSQGGQFVPVSHMPTKSCSCLNCLTHFSWLQSPSCQPQHQTHHFTEQDRLNDHSNYNIYPAASPHRISKDIYPQPIPATSENHMPMLSTYISTQKPRQDPHVAPKEIRLSGQTNLNPSSGQYQLYQDSGVQSSSLDTRLPLAEYQLPRQKAQFSYPSSEGGSFRRLNRDTDSNYRVMQETKMVVPVLTAPSELDGEQPLDLSVKSSPTPRRMFSDLSARDKGQYMENEQMGQSGHHLRRLENSVDKLLPSGQLPPQPQVQQNTHQTYLSLQGGKISSQEVRSGVRAGQSEHLTPQNLLQEPHNSRTSHYSSHSPIVYNQVTSDLMPPQQQPILLQPHHIRNLTPSPGGDRLSKSPSLRSSTSDTCENHHSRMTSPMGHHRPPSLGSEQKNRSTPVTPSTCVSIAAALHGPPSPEDLDNQNTSRHEPIQNIIGNHPPSDILYLICRLCRQTYGSPYGFRKHFRNQHGFEPKADHTIVQTISATKTAMVLTGPLDPSEELHLTQSPRDEKLMGNSSQSSKLLPSDSISTMSSHSSSSSTPEDLKLDLRKYSSDNTKCLECPECGQTFQLNDFGSYKRHCRQHNIHRNSGPFACHDCQRSFSEPDQLREHLVTHSSFTPSLCGICRTFFSSPGYLAEHIQAAHGHAYSIEDTEKSSSGTDSNRSSDCVQKYEDSSSHGVLSASDQSKGLTIVHGCASMASTPASSSPVNNNAVLNTRRHNFSRVVPDDSHIFTVHTPKGLEVKKLPADGIVTTASPDSSYDEAKLHLDSHPGNSVLQPGSSISQKATTPIETQNLTETTLAKDIKYENDSSFSDIGIKTTGISALSKKEDILQQSEINIKSEPGLNSVVSSNTVTYQNSSSEGTGASCLDESFYRHKKYSRYRKRASSDEMGNELQTKTVKVEEGSSAHRQSPHSVTSSVNSGVVIHDCESSCPVVEDCSSSLNRTRNEDGPRIEKKHSPSITLEDEHAGKINDLLGDVKPKHVA